MLEKLSAHRCTGDHQHDPCQGVDTKPTEGYSDMMAEEVHAAFKLEAIEVGKSSKVMTVKEEEKDEKEESHRPRAEAPLVSQLWCSMITKTISMKDPLTKTENAKKALDAELQDLRAQDTWDEENPMEAPEAKEKLPEAHFAKVFPFYGIKHYEEVDPAKHTWKCRVVAEGNHIRTASGEWAAFADLVTIPSTMSAARIAIAVHALKIGRAHV